MKKKLIGAILSFSFLINLTASVTAYATPLEDTLSNKQNQLSESKNSYDTVINKIENMESQIASLDSEIDILSSQISKADEDILELEGQIDILNAQIDEQSERVEYYKNLLKKKVKSSYINNTSETGTYIEILLNSKDIKDFTERFETIKNIITKDKESLDNYNDLKNTLENNKKELDDNKLVLVNKKHDLETKEAQLNATQNEEMRLLEDLNQQKNTYKSEMEQYQVDINKTLLALQQSDVSSGSVGQVIQYGDFTNIDVVNYALSFKGCPYLWGGTGLPLTMANIDGYRGSGHDISNMTGYLGKQAFDCSGLMQYVYNHFGMQITRTTYTQIKQGTSVSMNNLELADLIFFGNTSTGVPDHVGMYIGNGYFVEAPYSGAVVKVSSVSSRHNIIGARRYLS